MNNLLSLASIIITKWRECTITALEAEDQLLTLGFYNVNFRGKVTAAYLGVEYPLEA